MIKPIITIAKNQLIIETETQVIFQSYKTIVCTITNPHESNPYYEQQVEITEGQPQSKTTAKYLNRFLKEHSTLYTNYKEID